MLSEDATNYTVFRDCFSSALLQRISWASNTTKSRKKRGTKALKQSSENQNTIVGHSRNGPSTHNIEGADETSSLAQDLADFTEFLASEAFSMLPVDLQELSYSNLQSDPKTRGKWSETPISDIVESLLPTIPVSVTESLDTYSLLPPGTSFGPLFSDTISAYIDSISAPPPVWSTTRASECEICGRDWVPLTYHHLIPKEAHPKVIKRGWHEEWMLNSVAWLCRACHSYVHRVASNEELAKDYFTVKRLLEREDVQQWARWVERVRWKAR